MNVLVFMLLYTFVNPDFPAVVCASDLVFQDLEGGGAERDGLEGDGQERLKG